MATRKARAPSWEPEYRRAYYAKRKAQINSARREAYKNSPEVRARAAEQARAYRAANRDKLRLKDKERGDKSLVRRAKPIIGCVRCGYNNYAGALQWAHVERDTKICEPSWLLRATDEDAFVELRKCVLLCSNCHWEYDAGLWKVTRLMHSSCIRKIRKVMNGGNS